MAYIFKNKCFTFLVILISGSNLGECIPPASPIKCNQTTSSSGSSSDCILENAYGVWGDRKDCLVSAAVYPTTEEELRSAVVDAIKKKLKVKVVSGFSHTIPKLACPTFNASDEKRAILISTAKYNSGIDVDVANLRVTVEAGVGLRDLIDRVEEKGLSLVAAPYWEGVSVAGVISTGSHGSSWWGKGGAVHDRVIGIRLIVPAKESDGFAKIIDLKENDSLFNAAKVSIGVLGVISKVTIELEKAFKRSITFNFTGEEGMEEKIIEHGKKYEFGDIQWYPSQKTAVYRYDQRVPAETPGYGVNDFLGFQANLMVVPETVRISEKAAEAVGIVAGKCLLASTFITYKKLIANGLKNNNILGFTGYPVIGNQGKMQTSGSCLYSPEESKYSACAWDPRFKGLFFYESTAIFPADKIVEFIRDVKKLRDLNPQNFCGVDIYNGFLFRFIGKSDAYLGQSENSVVVDFNYYRGDESNTARLNEDVWEEIEQMAFFKYSAKPHWAKNRRVAFIGVEKKYQNFGRFVAAIKEVDAAEVFSGGWGGEVVVGNIAEVKEDGCALEGLCICSEDRHCRPEKGYLCRQGLVYEQARVCRYSPSN